MSESEAAVKGVRRPTSKERQNRFRLALWIVSFVLLAITALAFTVILATPADERAEVANDLFVALLPVFAAWVGTVIAFYFGQENFESASEQAQALVATTSGHDVQTPVTDVMQPIHEMVTYRMTGEAADVRLSDLQSDTYFGKVNRLLVVDEVDHPLLLVHRSRLADYLSADGDPAGPWRISSNRNERSHHRCSTTQATVSSRLRRPPTWRRRRSRWKPFLVSRTSS